MEKTTSPQNWPSWLVETLTIAAVYSCLGRLGQLAAIPPGNVTPIWLPSGFALAVVLIRGYRTWPGLWLGVLLANSWAFFDGGDVLSSARTLLVGACIGPGAILQALLGAYLINRWCTAGDPFNRLRDVFIFVGSQVMVCVLSATFGVLSLCLGAVLPWEDFAYTWFTWYVGDAIGIILVAPVLLTWPANPAVPRSWPRLVEFLTFSVLNIGVALLVFTDFSPFGSTRNPLAFLSLPLLLWAAVRFGHSGVSIMVATVSAIAVVATVNDYGPFRAADPNVSLILLQLFMCVSVVTGLSLSASLTEQSHSRRALYLSETRLEQALVAGNVGLWDWDLTTNKVFFSAQFKAQLGYDRGETWDSYHEWESRLHPDDRDEAVSRVRDYLDRKTRHYGSTFRLRHQDGSYCWILSRGMAEWDEQGQPLRIVGVHVDITERKLRAEELERTNLELEQFAYAASHDLQEPLRSIAGFAQLLERKHRGQLDQESEEWLAVITSGAKRLTTLVQDLLRYTGLAGESLPFEPTDVGSVVADALANLESSLVEASAEVTCDGAMPTVMGNPSQLVQLFQNLIGNAVKFRGTETPRVRIAAQQKHEEWLFSVRDNGIGIAPQYRKTIFGIFKRLQSRRTHPGNGIGLAICRHIAHRHRGEMWVESEVERGSTFFFTLPAEPREED